MNSNNSLILANVQNKIAILENAITQLIDMQTMFSLMDQKSKITVSIFQYFFNIEVLL